MPTKKKKPVKKKAVKKEAPERGLNPRQEMFCKLYATDREFFGNGVQSYLEVYGLADDEGCSITYDTAKVNASKLLTNTNILKRINELLEMEGLNDSFVDKQLNLLITQNADFKAKVAAIKEYNSLKNRIKQKIDINGGLNITFVEDLQD